MAAVLRKRKIVDSHHGESPAQRPISFGRVTKAGLQRPGKKPAATAQKPQHTDSAVALPDPKRRRIASSPAPATPRTKTTSQAKLKQQQQPRQSLGPSKPGEPRRIAPLKRSKQDVQDSPTQGARAILEAFVLAANSPSRSTQLATSEPIANATNNTTDTDTLSSSLQELNDLHAALLNALSLHYAHNGTASPADLRALCPSIEQLWGKRRMGADDVRRVLGVQSLSQNETLPRLILADFGRGKICIEYEAATTTSSLHHQASHAQPLPTAALRAAFARNLLKLGTQAPPLAEIAPYIPAAAAALSKGAQRLADIKAPALAAKQTSNAISKPSTNGNKASLSTETDQARPQPAASRGASLLDRIRAKEAFAAAQPAGPTPEQAARRAALQRLEDVIPVLSVLASRSGGGAASVAAGLSAGPGASSQGRSAAASDLAASLGLGGSRGGSGGLGIRSAAPAACQPTVSFTMAAVVQHLQQSLRHPMAREQAEQCVELLAADVLPRWVQVRRVGKLVSVSVRGSVGRGEWTARLAELLAE